MTNASNDSIAFFTLRCFIEYILFFRQGINTKKPTRIRIDKNLKTE